MTQENKELLLRDLCCRLPYGVALEQTYKVTVIATNTEEVLTRTIYLYSINSLDNMTVSGIHNDGDMEICFFEEIKPYLFPLSSMTEEQTEEVHNLIYQGVSESVNETSEWLKTRKENDLRPITLTYILSDRLVIDWFCKNHFDYRGLIPMGLAFDCTNLNIY